MGRARPLLLAMNALRRREEEMERRPGVIPGRGRGVNARFRSEGERVPGRENICVFMGRSRQFLAPPQIDIRNQPHTQPHCLALGSRSQSQTVAPPPIFLKIPLPCPTPILPCPVHVRTCAHVTNCHQPHPLPRMVSRGLHQSQKTLVNLLPHIHNSLNT